eukprot:scaffold12407_cov23-Cyclotella_meneghiniana.AAC.1
MLASFSSHSALGPWSARLVAELVEVIHGRKLEYQTNLGDNGLGASEEDWGLFYYSLDTTEKPSIPERHVTHADGTRDKAWNT